MKKTTELDRTSASVAQAIVEELFPSEHERYAILNRLLRSAEAAARVAPNAWAVTLFPNALRLNVGQAEVFVAAAPGFFLNCSALIGSPPFDTEATEPAKYKSVPQPQCRYWGNPVDLEHLPPEVESAHLKFIDLAARSPSGKPRAGTPLVKTHSTGLVAYAKSFVQGAASGA